MSEDQDHPASPRVAGMPSPELKRESNALNDAARQRHWLWGVAGSEINFILYCLVLFQLKRVVSDSDYKEFRIIWWSFVLTILITVLLINLPAVTDNGMLLAKGGAVIASLPSFFLMQRARLDGFVIKQLFGGVRTKNPYRSLFGLAFFGGGFLFLLMKDYGGTWDAIVGLSAMNIALTFSGFLIRIIRLAILER